MNELLRCERGCSTHANVRHDERSVEHQRELVGERLVPSDAGVLEMT